MMNTRVIVAALIAGITLACSDVAGELAGSMMRDAGDAVADAGAELQDADMRMLADAAIDAGVALEDAGVAVMDAGRAVDELDASDDRDTSPAPCPDADHDGTCDDEDVCPGRPDDDDDDSGLADACDDLLWSMEVMHSFADAQGIAYFVLRPGSPECDMFAFGDDVAFGFEPRYLIDRIYTGDELASLAECIHMTLIVPELTITFRKVQAVPATHATFETMPFITDADFDPSIDWDLTGANPAYLKREILSYERDPNTGTAMFRGRWSMYGY